MNQTKEEKILEALGDAEATASEISAIAKLHRPIVSMHMTNLTNAGLVARSVFGKCAGRPKYIYRLTDAGIRRLASLRIASRLEGAARKLFTVKGRHHSQIAMCELGELLGYPVIWPNKKEQEVE